MVANESDFGFARGGVETLCAAFVELQHLIGRPEEAISLTQHHFAKARGAELFDCNDALP